jgi:uncharacterized membrane protein
MKSFIKNTLIGGVLLLVPLSIVLFILYKVFNIFYQLAIQLHDYIPIESIKGVILINLIAVLLILLLCFSFGLIARINKVKIFKDFLEERVLMQIPGYIFFKTYTKGLDETIEKSSELDPVLVEFDDNYQLGFLIEEVKNGLSTVYLPGAPNPWSGSVIYVDNERIRQLDISARKAINHLQQTGKGIDIGINSK